MRKYGTIFVSVGIAISGAVWYLRDDAHVRGEDVAECYAALVERQTVAYVVGTNNPSWPSNTVSPHLLFATLYSGTMAAARTLATNSPSYSASQILWLSTNAALPQSGCVFSSNDVRPYVSNVSTSLFGNPAWGPFVTRRMSHTPATNYFDGLFATGSRWPVPGYGVTPDIVSKTNHPVARTAEYAAANWYAYNRAVGSLVPSASGSWWPDIGLGRTSYKYTLETYPSARFVWLAGTDFSPSSVTNALQDLDLKNDWTNVVTVSLGMRTNEYSATAWAVIRSGVSTAYYVNASSAAIPNLQHTAHNFTMPSYTTNAALKFYPPMTITNTEPWSFQLVYKTPGINVRPQIMEDYYFFFYPTANVGETGNDKKIFIESLAKTNGVHDIAIYTLTFRDQTHWFAATDIDTTGPQLTFAPSVNPTVTRGATTVATVTLNANADNVPDTIQNIRTNNLNEAKAVLSSMNRSMWVGGYELLETQTVSNFVSLAENSFSTNVSLSGSVSLSDVPALNTDDWLSDNWGFAFSVTNSEPAADMLFNVSVSAAGDRSGLFNDWDGGDDDVLGSVDYTFAANLQTVKRCGCRLPYPSDYACASGYVSRVTVYALARSYCAPLEPEFDEVTTNAYAVTASGDLGWPGSWSGVTYGALDAASAPGSFSGTNALTTSGCYDYIDAGQTDTRVLSLVATFDNPSARPTFDIGVDALDVLQAELNDARTKVESSETLGGGGTRYEVGEIDLRAARHVLKLTHFVVIVDWNWKHLNDSARFAPDAHTPEWITSNTNSP